MTGSLLQSMRDIAAKLVNAAGFESDITVTDNASHTAVVHGVATLHNTKMDVSTGLMVNARQAHCLLATSDLIAGGLIVYGDTKNVGKATLKGWKVSFADAHGKTWSFIVTDARPDETFGLITCFLGDKAT